MYIQSIPPICSQTTEDPLCRTTGQREGPHFGITDFGGRNQPLEMAEENQETEAGEAPVVLSTETIGQSLKGLAKTVDGLGFALTQLELMNQKIGDISALSSFPHIRYLNLSHNLITDLKPLENMAHILSLNVSNNNIVNVELPAFRFLQLLDLSFNKLIAVQNMAMPMLRSLKIGDNQIENIGGMEGNVALKILEVHNNKLTTCAGLGIPSLTQITLTGNQIQSTAGLESLAEVSSLDFTGNAIAALEGLPKAKLKKLILKQNQVAGYDQLGALAGIELTEMDLSENPISDGFDRIKVLRRVPSLQTLNSTPITDDERNAAKEPEGEPAA